jgi:CHAT domain-containing protein
VGDPAFHDDRRLSRLDGARIEAHHVARIHGTMAITGNQATRARILPRLATVRIAHLATHGRFRSGAPYSTELALAGHDSLAVPDLIGSRLQVELAILSACDSGRGRATAAGDFVGLTRAILGAGVRELVASMWPVHDMMTCLFMVAFHEHLQADPSCAASAITAAQRSIRALSPAGALERYELLGGESEAPHRRRTGRDLDAQADMPIDPAHPFYWAPFIHIGS